ncbi:MAG: YhgE/Pip domain-containing protein [Ruminococcaceae bacterium]|nr:YhgE/Pip domain-containing protein [Oscillospiraceae bacterium]
MKFRNLLKVYRRDLKSIMKNPVALLIMAGLCVIPSLYAWVNIHACWNVYENTGDIPVAVVNNDKAVLFQGKSINIGASVEEQLKKNKKIKWIFVSSRQADLGLADSTYYAAIEIPQDFSSKFLTVLSDHPQKPQIIYKADTKVNPVAGKIAETAKNTLVQQIQSNFVSTVNQTIFSELNSVGKDVDSNRESILKLKDSIIKLNSGMGTITDSLQTIHTQSDNVNALLDSISAALPSIQSGLQLAEKSNSDELSAVQSAKTALNNSIENVNTNLNYLQTSNTRIQELFDDLNAAVSERNTTKVNAVLPGINAELDSMDSALDATIDYLKACESVDLNEDIGKMVTSLQNLKTSLTSFKAQLDSTRRQITRLNNSLDTLYDYLNQQIPRLEQQVDELDSQLSTTISQMETLNETWNNPDLAQLINILKGIQSSGLKDALVSALESIRNSRDSAQAALKALDEALASTMQTIDTACTRIDKAISFLKTVEATNDDKSDELNAIIKSLKNIQPYLQDEKIQFSNIQQQLNNAGSIAKGIADAVNADAAKIGTQLNAALLAYNSGAKEELNAIADHLEASAKDSAELIQLAQELSTQLSNMVQTAQNGSSLASTLSDDLNKRLIEFKNVIALLGSKLEMTGNDDIAQIITILQSNPEFMGSFLSDPFDLKSESINAIPNYGSSMAPLYSTLALWVGCLVLNSILKPEVGSFQGRETLNRREKHFGKMMIFLTLSMIQGLIVALGDIFILKIYTVNAFLFVVFCVYSSFVFCVIIFTLMSTLGNIGKALSIIYMILQLAGSGGSYPIQVDPPIFKVLQPLFPFTYTVGGLREAVAGPLVTSVVQDFVALTLFGVVFLLFGFFAIEPLYAKIHRFERRFKESGIGE